MAVASVHIAPHSALRLHRRDLAGFCVVIAALHIIGFAILVFVVAPQNLHVGKQSLSIGLGLTAYILGVRHAFDADHIAVIDNTTRNFMNRGAKPAAGVGFWFALGHSSVVAIMTALVALGVRAAVTTMNGGNAASEWLSLAGTLTSGVFLTLVGLLNLAALTGIWRTFKSMRAGECDEAALEAHLNSRGLLARFLAPLNRRVSKPVHLYPIGLIMGLGFDTASEVTLLVLAGTGAASGLPWYAVMVLPLLFAAGMTLFDFADGVLMTQAYRWAFTQPVRKVYYNLTVTAMSVVVAFIIGGISLVGILHDRLGLNDPITSAIAEIDLGSTGFIVVGAFVAVWLGAIGYWKFGRVEERWAIKA